MRHDFDGSLSEYWQFAFKHDPFRAMDWGNYTLCIVVFCVRIHNVLATQDMFYNQTTAEMVGFRELATWYQVDTSLQAISEEHLFAIGVVLSIWSQMLHRCG